MSEENTNFWTKLKNFFVSFWNILKKIFPIILALGTFVLYKLKIKSKDDIKETKEDIEDTKNDIKKEIKEIEKLEDVFNKEINDSKNKIIDLKDSQEKRDSEINEFLPGLK